MLALAITVVLAIEALRAAAQAAARQLGGDGGAGGGDVDRHPEAAQQLLELQRAGHAREQGGLAAAPAAGVPAPGPLAPAPPAPSTNSGTYGDSQALDQASSIRTVNWSVSPDWLGAVQGGAPS